MSRPIRRVLCRAAVASRAVTVIHLGRPLPTASSALPVCSDGPPSNAHCLSLLRVGFTEPDQSPGPLVVSYTAVSPLPPGRGRAAVCFLWHCPAGHPGWPLATTLPCGARTFLGGDHSPTRPPGRLIHHKDTGGVPRDRPPGTPPPVPEPGVSRRSRSEPCWSPPWPRRAGPSPRSRARPAHRRWRGPPARRPG